MVSSASSGDRQTRAILLMVLGVGTLSVNDAIIKWLSDGLAVGQILCLRGVIVISVYGGVVGLSQGFQVFRMARPKVHLTRGLFLLASAYTFVTGLSLLPLADAFALSFAGPLFMVVLAILFLGERVGWRRWAAVVVGFIAVLVMLRPGTSAFQLAALFPLAAAFCGAARDAITRRMAREESTHAILLWGTAIVAVGGLASLPWGWGPVTWADGGLLLATAILQCLAHYLMIESFRYGETSLLAPFKYTGLVWGIIIGFLIWGTFPDNYILMGAAVISASGIYIARREAQAR